MDSVQDHSHNDFYRQSFVYTAEVVYASVARTWCSDSKAGKYEQNYTNGFCRKTQPKNKQTYENHCDNSTITGTFTSKIINSSIVMVTGNLKYKTLPRNHRQII